MLVKAMTPDRTRQHRSDSLHRLYDFDYSDADHAYFVTMCAEKYPAPFTDERLAAEIIASLHWLRNNRGLVVYAYCLMPDHLHLLVQLGDQRYTLGNIVSAFKTFTTRQSWKLGYHGKLWQARFYDHIVRRSENGKQIARYILANPVRKGIVAIAEEYVWSGTPDPL